MFVKPDRRKYGAKPFWAWNGELNKAELLRQTDVIKEMGFGGFFMHSRTGLVTEYLGDEWFEYINACADKAESDNMEAWLYDEDRWPSGSAGGIATKDEKYRMQYIRCNIVLKDSYEASDDCICAFAADVDGINYTNCIKIEKHTDLSFLPQKNVIFFTTERMSPEPTYNGSAYLDTLSAEATQKFIESTHELYAKKCGKRLGVNIQGIFTDEPHRGALMSGFAVPNRDAGMLAPYTDKLFAEFEKSFGYDLKDSLPRLFLRENGKYYAKVKWQYTELLSELFLKNFAKPYLDWCREHNLLVTGHVLHEDNLSCQVSTNGSVMRYYEYMDIPGVDVLCNNNKNYCIVKQLASVARQTGKKILMSELNGCTGWQMRFNDYKAIGDWQAIMGINLRCPHLSWYSMRGEAKRDYPASILHQSAWYKVYSVLEDHYTRIGEITANTDRICSTAVIMPVESLWVQIYAGWANFMSNLSEEIAPYEKDFENLYRLLLASHIDYDFADEEMLSRLGKTDNNKLIIGKAEYRRVIVPSMLTIRRSTLEMLKAFKDNGGEVIFAGITPILVDAEESEDAIKFAEACARMPIADLSKLTDDVTVSSADILLQSYKDENNKYFFLLNESTEERKNITVDFGKDEAIQIWDTVTGDIYGSETSDGRLNCDFAPGQLKLIVIPNEISLDTIPVENFKTIRTVEADAITDLTLDEPNVLTLDYARFSIDGSEFSDRKEILIADRLIRNELGLPVRGGLMYQPWFIAQNKPKAKAKVAVEYTFDNNGVTSPLYLCCEEANKFDIDINGKKLTGTPITGMYIDACFNRFDITDYVISGKNTITITTDYAADSNSEAVYILGNFAADTNETVKPMEKIGFGDLAKQGLPFYGGKLTYSLHFSEIPAKGQRAVLHLADMENAACYGVGNKRIAFAPYTCDVTEELDGNGNLDLDIYLTRRNMFGPLHGIPKVIGAIGPEHFYGGDSTDYVLMESGLTKKPFIEIIEG